MLRIKEINEELKEYGYNSIEAKVYIYDLNGEYQAEPVDIFSINFSNQFTYEEILINISLETGLYWYKKYQNNLCDIRTIELIYHK